MGDGEIVIVMEGGHSPQPGQWFGLKDKELYRIEAAEDQGDDTWLVTFEPTLRRDAEYGERVDFDDPKCELRGAADQTGRINYEAVFRGEMALDLVEAVP